MMLFFVCIIFMIRFCSINDDHIIALLFYSLNLQKLLPGVEMNLHVQLILSQE